MKTKLLFTFLSFLTFFNSFSQTENSNYVSSLINPSKIVRQGNIIYIQGDKNLYKIDTSVESPLAESIYSPEANYYITNITINDNVIYLSEENYDAENNTSSGSRIVAISLNVLNLATVIYTTPQYISALAIKGDFMYFTAETTPDANDHYIVQVHKFLYSSPNSLTTIIINNLTQNNAASDMAFYNNNLLILVGRQGKVFGFDVTDVINVTEYYSDDSNINKPTGIEVSGNSLFIAEGNVIKYKGDLNSDSPFETIAINTNPLAKKAAPDNLIDDVVLIGDKLYMTLPSQGKLSTMQDSSLSTNQFNQQDSNTFSIYNSSTKLTVLGLKGYQTATVYNLSGQLLFTKELSSNDNTIDINFLSNGAYILKLEGGKIFKFIK